ncbi:MAG: purine-nucleoside phosphorylase [Peptostreptococcaceae bacterium]|nr:purine-nucleoside phosphorylase [Peptostreptococcaceae bacterium]
MSVHIEAKKGDIADTVLLPGDPLRAKFIAENFFEDAFCYNKVRGMYGYTGTYKGKRISVQGTGMGMPSLSIYVTELINEYGVKNLIRVGSCGSYQENIKVRDVIVAQAASSDSSMTDRWFGGMNYASCADYGLLEKAVESARRNGIKVNVGNILSTDLFYKENPDEWKTWAAFGVLGVEMEAAALYTIAARRGTKALAILTVSDSIVTGESTTAEEREKTFRDMIEIALGIFE